MDTNGYIIDTTYTAATAAWIYQNRSWILHTQQQQHGYTWRHAVYYVHSSSSSKDTHGYIMGNAYTSAAARVHMYTSWIINTLQQHGCTWIHHGYYIHSSSSMDTHRSIMYTAYTAATLWIHMDSLWKLHTQQQEEHGYTWIHHGYYIHISSSTDTHGYIKDTTYTAVTAWLHMEKS
jgi:hypothetical protein